ncbi:hypothetical protein GKA92_24750, partial [Salmonella enterica subsp. enterica]|nr:hypothetical protein [Salmonella enterica subsp. enterica serovar Abaetetuba]
MNGNSENGSGVVLGSGEVSNAILQGTSNTGGGVEIAGNVTLDDVSASALSGTSVEGDGLILSDGASVGATDFVTSESVTSPVILNGTSQNGSGVSTSGNVSISGVVLNGSATAAEGSGATLGGNLTIADNMSGITVNATGNGTALVVDNVTINADGYTSTGKGFVINASTSDSSGTAIKTQGNNQLADVTLNGSASNGGTAVELGGQVSGG